MKCIEMKIPSGHRTVIRSRTVDIDEAVKILTSRRKNKYFFASRKKGSTEATLTQNVWICPYCNYEKTSYYDFFELPKKLVREWGTRQLNFLPELEEDLIISAGYTVRHKKMCPKCERESMPSERMRDVRIYYSKHKIRVACEILGVEELLSVSWLPQKQLVLKFPLYEICTFNFRKGKVYVEIGDADSTNVIARTDITNQPEMFSNGAVNRVISSNVNVSRTLKRLFAKKNGGSLPFRNDELTPLRFCLMTRYIGFGRSFYDAVPFHEESYEVDAGFRSVEKKLHTRKRAEEYFCSSSLPNVKSVRRIFFSKSGLLFYLPEAEAMWEVFQDPNLFCELIQDKYIYDILADIHQFPGILIFLRAYVGEKSKRALLRKIKFKWQETKRYALNYCAMSNRLKKEEQELWKKESDPEDCERNANPFSRPFFEQSHIVRDCTIDGIFRFELMLTSRDYVEASKELNNCLGNWSSHQNPVVRVRKEGKTVAAIEVNMKGRVIQAYSSSNNPLSQVQGLEKAYEKWKEKFTLTEYKFKFDDIEDILAG